MARINVDLPEPDGPQMTIFSPSPTSSETFCKTRSVPKFFSTPCKAMAVRAGVDELALADEPVMQNPDENAASDLAPRAGEMQSAPVQRGFSREQE
jgi:hypothetical protein